MSRKERPPWPPERGQRVRFTGTRLSVSEWTGFTLAMATIAFCVALLIVAVVVF